MSYNKTMAQGSAVTKTGFVGIMSVVAWFHWIFLHHTAIKVADAKPTKTKSVIHVRLATLAPPPKKFTTPPKPKPQTKPISQPTPKVAPIILPPDLIAPTRIVQEKPIKKVVKPRKKRHVRKKRTKKPIRHKIVKRVEPQIVEEASVAPIQPQPVVQQQLHRRQIDTAQKSRYLALIRRRIKENLYYPRSAKRMHIQGAVRVAFRVSGSGEIGGIRVLESPNRRLSEGAKRTLESISLPPIPAEIGAEHLELTIPIEFKLN